MPYPRSSHSSKTRLSYHPDVSDAIHDKSRHACCTRAMSHSADPHLPSSRATNGFLALCTTYALFALYLLWALLPSRITTSHPFLTWLPNQCVALLSCCMVGCR